jgi:hypothetical protein
VVLVVTAFEFVEALAVGDVDETDLVTVAVVVFKWVVVTVAVLVIVAVAVVVTVEVAVVVAVVVVINAAGLGEHPLMPAPADPRGGITETDPPPLFAT